MRWGWWHFKRRSRFFHWIPWQQKAWKNRPFSWDPPKAPTQKLGPYWGICTVKLVIASYLSSPAVAIWGAKNVFFLRSSFLKDVFEKRSCLSRCQNISCFHLCFKTHRVCFKAVFHVAFICLLRFELCNINPALITPLSVSLGEYPQNWWFAI